MSKATVQLQQRPCNPELLAAKTDLHPVLQRVFSAREIESFDELDYNLKSMLDPARITHLQQAAELLCGHIEKQSSILIFGDYDADGATSTALCLRALTMFGHHSVDFLLPDRVRDGYGVSTTVVQHIIEQQPDLVITVDTGIASFDGLTLLAQAGIDVIVTDHHLAADQLPQASVIVNPNAFDNSAGKNLAGVGVAFYLMLALRSALRDRGWFEGKNIPNLAELLDLVAIGSVADLVPLDHNNRILINEGLKRLRAGACSAGIQKIIELSGRSRHTLSSQDIAFSIAPRLNAAGRLDDMSIGVQTLLADSDPAALQLANELEMMNRYRREIQAEMTGQATAMLPQLDDVDSRYSIVLHQDDWHEGVVGILASKIKDTRYRPSICFATSSGGELKGSGRSISGIHLRDMLDLVDKQNPGLIIRFGGHAMAAGLSISSAKLDEFTQAFESVLQQYADAHSFSNILYSDGQIEAPEMTLQLAKALRDAGPWGQRFPAPVFDGEFSVQNQRVLTGKHLKFVLKAPGAQQVVDAIFFFASAEQLKTNYQQMHIVYELSVNEFRGQQSVQLMIKQIL
jgi:single-stranded-DNA-specific exonuclease